MSELPLGWVKCTFSELGETRLGKMLDKQKNSGIPLQYLRNVNVRWFRFDLSDLQTIFLSADEARTLSILDGDLLICEGGEPGRAAVWRGGTTPLTFQKALHRLRVRPGVLPEFVMFRLRADAYSGALSEAFTGTTIKHLTGESLARYMTTIPPMGEQKRVVTKISNLVARVEACRARLDQVRDALKKFREAVLEAAVSGRLTEEWRASKPVVTGFSVARMSIGDLGTVVTGSTPPKDQHGVHSDGLPFFKPTELDSGYRVMEAKERISEGGRSRMRVLPPKSVLVTCIGATIGKTGLSRREGATNQQINAVICNEQMVLPEFLYFWCTSPDGQREIIDNASATTLPILNKSKFSALEVPVPALEEQREIVRRVECLFAFSETLQRRYDDAVGEVEKLTPSVLAKAFRGELVPQDPNDEPAGEMLERIRAGGGAKIEEGVRVRVKPGKDRVSTLGKREGGRRLRASSA